MAKYKCGDHWCTDEELEQLEKVRDGKLQIVNPEEKEGVSLPEPDLSVFHKRFDELAHSIEQAMPKKVEPGSDEWKAARKTDLDHMLFGDCPECAPIRDEILQAKGKSLTDVEPDIERKVENDVESKVEAPELETSTHPKRGFKWDWEKRLYVKKQEGGGE